MRLAITQPIAKYFEINPNVTGGKFQAIAHEYKKLC